MQHKRAVFQAIVLLCLWFIFSPWDFLFGLVWFYFLKLAKDFCQKGSLQLLYYQLLLNGKEKTLQASLGIRKCASDGEALKQKRINTTPVTHGGVCSLHRSLQFPICLRDTSPQL